ncbi:DNA repair helicase rad5-16 [Penicillium canariense]|uniref:DNA repair helicase rad5-16 n=1 Tax=Penicillium canariense TaxID=189055 RepID=A0A9W9HWC5_9EURO|nr:DNA repair helicase rad5-16 [Penicillium canariense]KAJ5160214.1 DNA repair helicase rad5-16 [Penicillium canariense]
MEDETRTTPDPTVDKELDVAAHLHMESLDAIELTAGHTLGFPWEGAPGTEFDCAMNIAANSIMDVPTIPTADLLEGVAADTEASPTFSIDSNTVGTANPDEVLEEDQVTVQEPYTGRPRQGKENLARAIDKIQLSLPRNPNESSEIRSVSSHGEDFRRELQDAEDDEVVPNNAGAGLQSKIHDSDDKAEQDDMDYEWQKEDYIAPEELSDRVFRVAEEQYKRLKNPSAEDTVLFAKARREEELRLRVLQSRIATTNNLSEEVEDRIFMEETNDSESFSSVQKPALATAPTESTQAQVTRKRKVLKPSQKEQIKSMEIGLQKMIGTNQYTTGLSKIQPGADQQKDPDKTSQRKSRKKTTRLSEGEILSLFSAGDVISAAQANESLPEIPTFTKKDKEKALTEIVASIPAADQAVARSDKRRILEATRKFDNKPSSKEDGTWKMKGLKCPGSWLDGKRERERSPTLPIGGLLCDVMGLGKTVTTLANILDGRCLDRSEERTPTLIIVPAGLVGHWAEQINKHCEQAIFGVVLEYHRNPRMSAQNDISSILFYNVVLVSYDEVRRSYPPPNPPTNLQSHEDIQEWWLEFYKESVGVLHQIRWHRIILDEGHVIKNRDSAVSTAVRALTGVHKWILSGTPLHNCVEELFPYFNFIGVPSSASFEQFEHAYCDRGERSRKRLVNILRSILHRKTHESRLFALPIVKLPPITQRNEFVELCEAEKVLYRKIEQVFIDKINDLSSPNRKASQWQCILTMFLKLRMFASHLLAAQDIVSYVLTEEVFTTLRPLSREGDTWDNPSSMITKMLLLVKSNHAVPTAQKVTTEDDIARIQPTGDCAKLTGKFRQFMEMLQGEGRWKEQLHRLVCPSCAQVPVQAVITSCYHLYCEECFHQLPDEGGRVGAGIKLCCVCDTVILEAADCGTFDKINPDRYESSVSPSSSFNSKRKPSGKSKQSKSQKRSKKALKRLQSSSMFHQPRRDSEHSSNDDSSDEDDTSEDWIPIIGPMTPSAKLLKVRELTKAWIESDEDVKIVLFTQFLDIIRLLQAMCSREGWGFTTISGKLSPTARDNNRAIFCEQKETKVMIVTLKTGGVGLDLSVANKCILVDLWWNEAIQDQACCRLFRIGQKREVECVRLVAKETIDEKMISLQEKKTREIQNVISLRILESRDTVRDILEFFGEVTQVEGGGFRLTRTSGE